MIKNVHFSDKFTYNVASLLQNTEQFSEDMYKIILLKIENIRIFPKMYPVFENTKYRKFWVKNYIILYIVKDDLINIYDIFPIKSNYKSLFY